MATESISHNQVVSPVSTDAVGIDKIEEIRRDFPALSQTVHGKPLVYLDNAASAQKPRAVLDAEMVFYRESYANVHRGLHYLSEKATRAYEAARTKVQRFINAAGCEERQ